MFDLNFSPELQVALASALAVGSLTLIASVTRTIMWNRSEHNGQRHEARMSFLQAQISELYSPLLGYLSETNTYYQILRRVRKQLRESGRDGNAGSDAEERIRALEQRFDNEYFNPLKNRVAELLRAKRHLVVEDQFPAYFSAFLQHATEWEALQAISEELGEEIETEEILRAGWPDGIVDEVEHTLSSLRQEYRRHLKSLGRLRRS